MIEVIIEEFDKKIKSLFEARNKKGLLPLELATERGEYEIFRKIINHKVSGNLLLVHKCLYVCVCDCVCARACFVSCFIV